MSSIIRATTTSGLQIAPDNSGSLILQTNGTTAAVTLDTSQNATFAGKVTSAGALTLASNGTTTAVTIDTSQNVGIGTSSPFAKLTVKTATDRNLLVSTNGVGNINDANNAWQQTNVNGNPLIFGYGQFAAEAMRIDSSGNVLVGSTSTTGRISSTNDNTFNATGTPSNLQKTSFVSYGTFGGGFTVMDGTQGYVLYAQTSGADFYIRRGTTSSALTGGVALINAATSWSSASDENVKDIIEPIENAIEKISTLRTVIGKYKDEKEGIRHPFLIAQDVEKVLPEAISIMNKDSENECLGLSYTDTIPLLIAAIKEQQIIINDLKSRIETLESK
jgi:hypothetical protein